MRRINENDINRLVKKILLEKNDIKINGVNVSIDDAYDSKIFVGNNAYWVRARNEEVTWTGLVWGDFEDAHIVSIIKTSAGGIQIKTLKKTISLDKSQVDSLFQKLNNPGSSTEITHKDSILGVKYEVVFLK